MAVIDLKKRKNERKKDKLNRALNKSKVIDLDKCKIKSFISSNSKQSTA